MVVLYIATDPNLPTSCDQIMNGCVINVFDRYLTLAVSDCIWIVPGTFDAFA